MTGTRPAQRQPERINVMISRARQQLVLIGDFDYYRQAAQLLDQHDSSKEDSFWTRLLNQFNALGTAAVDDPEAPVIIPAQMIPGVI